MSTKLAEIVQEEQQAHDNAEIERRRENVEDTPAERELESVPDQETDPEDTDEEETPAEKKPTGRSLFDATLYESEPLSLPKVDGEGVDKIAAKFNGLVRLDRGDEADVQIIKGCKLGQTVTLMVEAEVGPPVPGMTTNRDGDLDSLGLSRTFTVKHVYKPAAEEL